MLSRVIINADDGFYSDLRDAGILSALLPEAVGISDVSVIVTGAVSRRLSADSGRRAESALYAHFRDLAIAPGLHINITEGVPLLNGCKSIVNNDYEMLGKEGLKEKLLSNQTLDLTEIENEMELQILRYTSLFGRPPSHIDGHQHAHILPGINVIFSKLLKKYGVMFTRIPIECLPDKTSEESASDFFEDVMKYSKKSIEIFNKNGLRYPHFIGMSLMGRNLNIENVKTAVLKIKEHDLFDGDYMLRNEFLKGVINNTVELMVHPGYVTESEGGCGRNGPDSFSKSMEREHELQLLQSKEMKNLLKEINLIPISFDNLLEFL